MDQGRSSQRLQRLYDRAAGVYDVFCGALLQPGRVRAIITDRPRPGEGGRPERPGLVHDLVVGEHEPHGSAVGPCSQLTILARMRAVDVLPVPLGPQNRNA